MNGYDFRRVSAVVRYAACFAATWGLIGLEPRLRLTEVAVAFVLQVLVGVLIAYQSRFGDGRVGLSLGMVAFLGSVALLRDGVGPTPAMARFCCCRSSGRRFGAGAGSSRGQSPAPLSCCSPRSS